MSKTTTHKSTVNLTAKLKNLDGSESEKSMGHILATVLVIQNTGDALKYYTWALDLYNDKPIEMDLSDFGTFKEFVKNCEQITAILKAQILLQLN